MERRHFLKSAAGVATALSVSAISESRSVAASERVRVGWIGCGVRGRFVAAHMSKVPGVELVAACDVYEKNVQAATEMAGGRCDTYGDFRKLLDRKDIDAVLVATPDHWHAIPMVMACEAGKDVYVEKPLAHNIKEGQAMVRAARKHQRVVQTGTQQHSAPHFEQMRAIIQGGDLGKVRFIRIWNYRNSTPGGIGRKPDGDPPAGLDWDFYLGPAPLVPFNPNRFLSLFRNYWDYAGGIITDWGTHRFESMQHVMEAQAPRTVTAVGHRYELDDDGQVPDMMQVTYEYPDFIVSYEACALNAHGCGGRTPGRSYYEAKGLDDRPNGLAFYGTNGALFADRIGFEIYPDLKPGVTLRRRKPEEITPELFRMGRKEASSPDSTYLHAANFIECVRSRAKPAADVEIGHRASTVAHLGNIALKTGRKLTWDAAREEIVGDPEASKLLGREARKPWDLI